MYTVSSQCSTIYGFFPNLPCLSLFFLNLPCCISFFFSFPCGAAPLLAVGVPPSNFLFLSLSGTRHHYKQVVAKNVSTATKHCRRWLHLLMLTIAVFPAFFNASSHSSSSPRILYLRIQRDSFQLKLLSIAFDLKCRPRTHSSRSISFTFSTSCLCRSSNSFAASSCWEQIN